MKFKYGDIIKLKDNARPRMSLDAETFFSLPDDEKAKIKTYWSLPKNAFEIDNTGSVYLKAEYARRLCWNVDEAIRADGINILNINVAYDPEGDINCGAFCAFIFEEDVKEKC